MSDSSPKPSINHEIDNKSPVSEERKSMREWDILMINE